MIFLEALKRDLSLYISMLPTLKSITHNSLLSQHRSESYSCRWQHGVMIHIINQQRTACRHIQTKKDERNYFTLSSTFNFPEVSRSTLITRRSKSARSNSSLPLTLRAISNPVTAACTDNNTFHFSGSRCTLFNMKYSIIFFKIFHM